jgi:hypothetical protein
MAFVLQVYALASVWGQGEFLEDVGNHAGAFLSRSYGMRHLTEVVVVLAPGLALLLERAPRIPFRLLCGVGFLLDLWNLLLVCQYNVELLPPIAGADLQTLLTSTLRFIQIDPAMPLVLIQVLGLIGAVLLWRNEEPRLEPAQEEQRPGRDKLILFATAAENAKSKSDS